MKIALVIFAMVSFKFLAAQNVGINTPAPQAYGHGGTNRLLELKNDAGTGANIQSHFILSSTGTSGALGSLTWAAPNITGAEKRTGLLANLFETLNATRLAFYTRSEAGSLLERLSISGNGNMGLGINNPGFPLTFSTTTGDKISLYGNAGNHYGFGIQPGLLQIHTDLPGSNIAFGQGASGNFTERMRILNNSGYDGMSLNGRLILKNGSTDLVGGGGGVWLYKADNSAQLGFMGTQNNQNIGFFGGPAGWGFTYDAINSRVGIGNNNPNAPLAFPPSLGKKITLYPGAGGDAGFSVAGNRLQIYSDNPNADIALGYDVGGNFNERFAFKPTGAMAVSGNTGSPGQVLTSNGAGSAASWSSTTNQLFNGTHSFGLSGSLLTTGNHITYDLAGLNQNIVLTQTSKVLVAIHVAGYNNGCFACADAIMEFRLYINNASGPNFFQYKSIIVANGKSFDEDSGFRLLTLGPGTHNFKMVAQHNSGGDVIVYPDSSPYGTRMMIIVIPQ